MIRSKKMKRFQKFMIGRYGADQLYYLLLLLSIVSTLISMFTGWQILDLIAVFFLFFAIYRVFSKDINRRYQENIKLLNKINPIRRKVKSSINKVKSRKHYRYLPCPNCRQELRVPKDKGKIMVNCPKCKTKFQTQT